MRYVPNLIPKELRVLPEYFKGDRHRKPAGKPVATVLGFMGSSLFALFALISIAHPLMFVLYSFIAIILFPPLNRAIEKALQFRFTTKIKAITSVALFVLSMPLYAHYNSVDIKLANTKLLVEKHEKQAKADADKLQKAKRDTFLSHFTTIVNLEKADKTKEALEVITIAEKYAVDANDILSLETERDKILTISAQSLIKSNKYKDALPVIESILSIHSDDAHLKYDHALCLSKVGQIQDAVNELKSAIANGSNEAEKLHDKINPVRKRIAYYTTLCCDGSFSSATGRGACSWHDGVCEWNHPVYEEYRKYE